MAYTTIDNPELYFQAKLFTGNGSVASSTQSITFDGSENMQPDFVWFKKRDGAEDHEVFDSVRGVQKAVDPNNINAEATGRGLTSFNSNGFTVGNGSSAGNQGATNEINKNFVTWNWAAGGSASSNTDGDVTSSVSANTTSGFSIAKVSNLNSNSFGHGLGAEPELIFNKRLDDVAGWRVYFKGITSGNSLFLNSDSAEATEGSRISSANSTTITVVGSGNGGSAGTGDTIYYSFVSKKGFSRIGTYKGNGNADGTFVYTGFKPAFVLMKKTSGGQARNWCILDNKREGFNPENDQLHSNTTGAESMGSGTTLDLLSNGFKLRVTDDDKNGSGDPYIFMALAESPFTNSNGVPTNAR